MQTDVLRGTDDAASLPPDVVKAAIQKNLVNIAKKAAAGKTLSSRELRMLEELKNPETKQRIVESMPAAAVLANTTVEVVKRAKKLACPAFLRNNRIDVPVLIRWLRENEDRLTVQGDQLSLKDQKLNEEVRRLRRNNDEEDGILIRMDEHKGEIRSLASAVTGVLVNIPSRLALDLAGRSIPEIESRLQSAMDEAIGKLSRGEQQ